MQITRQVYRTSSHIRKSTEVKHHVSFRQLQSANSGSKAQEGKKVLARLQPPSLQIDLS